MLKPANPAGPSTQIDEVAINYLPKNVAPVVDDVVVQTGARFQPQPHISSPGDCHHQPGASAPAIRQLAHGNSADGQRRTGADIAVRWGAHDENDDNLVYSVYYRGDKERDWKLLKSGLIDKFYSFESGFLPDGGYTVKVVASDAPSHSPEDALSDEKESQRFEVDNTAPRMENLAARVEGQDLHVTFHAADDGSPIKRAEFSIDAGDWRYVEPWARFQTQRARITHLPCCCSNAPPAPEEPVEPEAQKGQASSGGWIRSASRARRSSAGP